MGMLIIPRNMESGFKNHHFVNENAVDNLIRYITRTRINEQRQNQLLFQGAICGSTSDNPDEYIWTIKKVQEIYNIKSRGGRRMLHEVFAFRDEEVLNSREYIDLMKHFAYECASQYYLHGFQVVYAMHYEPVEEYVTKWHIHFAISSINYATGYKWSNSMFDIQIRESLFNQILLGYRINAGDKIIPLYFGSKIKPGPKGDRISKIIEWENSNLEEWNG